MYGKDDLWKKEANGVLYVDLFKHIPSSYKLPDVGELNAVQEFELQKMQKVIGREKGNEGSKAMRVERGNELFKLNRIPGALMAYNRSISAAEIGSKEIALAYANRSACFLKLKMYEKCLIDIDLALKVEYPQHLIPKLEKRRVDCLLGIEKGDQYKEFVPKLDYDDNECYPGMANVLEIKYNEKYGRHIVAKCDIEVGKTVIVDEAYVFTTSPKLILEPRFCETCYKGLMNFIPCNKCTIALFCDQSCMDNNEFHPTICEDEFPYATFVLCIIRSILKIIDCFANVEQLMKFVEDVVANANRMKEVPSAANDALSKYRMFLSLFVYITADHWWMVLIGARNTYNYLTRLPAIRKKFQSGDKKRFFMHLCVMHTAVVYCNPYLNSYMDAVFMLKSFLNHSCAPNVLCYKYGDKNVCVSTRPIRKGDQLFIPYGRDSTRKRLAGLRKEYHFKCECVRCQLEHKWPISSSIVKTDSDYQFVFDKIGAHHDSVITMAHQDIWLTDELIKKCFQLLKKFGDLPWNEELDFILYRLRGLLSEKVLMSPNRPTY